jgi:hypothetical protein
MAVEGVRIDSLHLRVPGLGPEEARRLGEEVARMLAERLPQGARPQSLGALSLCVSSEPGATRSALAERIVASLLESLR